MITAERLTKRYGATVVLDEVDFTIDRGEAVALWGPNGAGKTTVVRCLLGLTHYEGHLLVDGRDIRRHGKDVRRMIGYVPQNPSFYPDLSVEETLIFSARLRRLPRGRCDEVLGVVHLDDERHKAVHTLSGGMMQRLALAVALLPNPPVLLVDEPTSHLDVEARLETLSVLEGLHGPDGSMLLTTHRVEETEILADRVLTMAEGRITGACTPWELARRLGDRTHLHLIVADEDRSPAVQTLEVRGIAARKNGAGVIVDLSSGEPLDILAALQDTGIHVIDLEVRR